MGVAVHPSDPRYTHLIGKHVRIPHVNRIGVIVGDEAVDPEFGTGAVKITPAHDPTDFEIAQRHDLPAINVMNLDGTMNAEAGAYAGLTTQEARKRMVAELEQNGQLVKQEPYTHAVGHCQRSGTVLEPLLLDQWYLRIKPLADPALDGGPRRPDSDHPRALRAGVLQLDGEHPRLVHLAPVVVGPPHSAVLLRRARVRASCGPASTSPSAVRTCGSTQFHQDPDVLDTWFSSGLWPFSTLGWPDDTADLRTFYPTSVMETGHDILFFWVARMIMFGLEFTGAGAVPHRLPAWADPRRRRREDEQDQGQRAGPAGADRRVRHRRAATGRVDRHHAGQRFHAHPHHPGCAAGVPAIVEKPVAHSLEAGLELAAAAEKANARMLVGHHRRYSAIIAKAVEVIRSGALGRLVAVVGTALFYKAESEGYFDGPAAWRREPGGGPIMLNMIHEIGNLRALVGEIVAVHAFAANATRGFAVEDTAAINLRFENGALGAFLLSDTAATDRSWEHTSGEDEFRYAKAHTDEDDCYLVCGTFGSLAIPTMRLRAVSQGRGPLLAQGPRQTTIDLEIVDPLAAQIAHFCDVIEGRQEPWVSVRDGLRNLHVVEAIHESARTGQIVTIAS